MPSSPEDQPPNMRIAQAVQILFVMAIAAYAVFATFAYRPVPLVSRIHPSESVVAVSDVQRPHGMHKNLTAQIVVEGDDGIEVHEVVQQKDEVRVTRFFAPFEDRCGSKRCQFGQRCGYNLMDTAVYIPEGLGWKRVRKKGQFEEFKAYICSLKKSPDDPMLDPFADRTTVGKTYRSWVNLLIEFAFWPDAVETARPTRYVMNATRIADWHWLNQKNQPNDECRASRGYLNADVCAKEPPQPWLRIRLSKAFGAKQDGESLLFMWFLSARMVFENALKPCFHELLSNEIERSMHVYPRYERKPTFRNAIAMHIRRGDACERWSSTPGDLAKPRPCYTTDLYFKAAVTMKNAYGSDQILLATEDEGTIAEAKEFCDKHGFRLYYLKYNRKPFDVKDEIAKQREKVEAGEVTPEIEKLFIEEKDMSASDQRSVTLSLFADIKFLSNANMLIGTSTSWVSRILWMVIGGTHEQIPPFTFIDSPFVNRKLGSDITWESAVAEGCRLCKCSI